MPWFTRRLQAAQPTAEIIPAAPLTLDDQVDDLDADLVDRAYARAARERALDVMSREAPDQIPTDVLLRTHLEDVVEGRR